MREEDIRPTALMERKCDCLEHDRRFLLERQERFVTVPCPACDGSDLEPAFVKQGFAYQRCRACETVLMNPRADQELMHEFYGKSANYEFWNKFIFPVTEAARRDKMFRPRAQQVAKLCRSRGLRGGTALEVGAAYGTFCEELRRLELFDRVIALEPTPGLAQTCRDRGLETIEMPFEHCDLPDGSVDLIAAFEVVEHLFCPAQFLRRAAALLKPQGLVVLSCPNIKGFDLTMLGSAAATIDHEHVNYFHPASIQLLLERCGLEVLEVLTPGRLDVDLVHTAVRDGRCNLEHQPFFQQLFGEDYNRLGGLFQDFLAANGLSGHMWAVAAKKQSNGGK